MIALQGCYLSHGVGEDLDAGTMDASRDGGRDIGARDIGGGDVRPDVPRDVASDALDTGSAPRTCVDANILVLECAPSCDHSRAPVFHWMVGGCVPVTCGECIGPCDPPTATRAECEEAHRHCPAQLCRDTGGAWVVSADGECAHRACGRAVEAACGGPPAPICDCGALGVFEEGVGCVVSDACEPETLRGEALCLATGGSWGPTCCHSKCGEPCADDCASPACTCGPTEVFDVTRGCTEAEECFLREPGQTCGAFGQTCTLPYLCCENCRGGCMGDFRCSLDYCEWGACRVEGFP